MNSLSLGWFSCKRVSTKPQGSSSLLMSNTCDNYLSESKCVCCSIILEKSFYGEK